MADLDWLRQKGRQIEDSGKAMIGENIDDPMHRAMNSIRQLAAQKAAIEAPAPAMAPRPLPGLNDSQVQGLHDMQALNEREHARKLMLEQQAKQQQAQQQEDENAVWTPFTPHGPPPQQEPQQKQDKFAALKKAIGQQGAMSQPDLAGMQQMGGMIELSEDPEEMQRQIEAAHQGR